MTKLQKVIGIVLASSGLCAATIMAVNGINVPRPTRASGPQYILNHSNAPDSSGVVEGESGIIWKYHNFMNYSGGHVILNPNGYFGIEDSPWGITGISGITADFSASNGSELWLLTSYDGIEWHEQVQLQDDITTDMGNHWKYVRFYHYTPTVNPISINSITIDWSCAETNASEDVDSAKISNIYSITDNLTATDETIDVSPRDNSTHALKLTKEGKSGSNVVISLFREYVAKDIAYQKIEFDMKTSNINYDKTFELMNNGVRVGTMVSSKNAPAVYHCTPLDNDWYHIEIPVSACLSLISGYGNKDVPANGLENKIINTVKLNCGDAVIDNLRIGGTQCALGIFNSPTWVPKVGEYYWFKVAWVGKLHSCEITLDNNIGTVIPTTDPNLKHGSPFYIHWEAAGEVTINCRLIVGYNRVQQNLTPVHLTIANA